MGFRAIAAPVLALLLGLLGAINAAGVAAQPAARPGADATTATATTTTTATIKTPMRVLFMGSSWEVANGMMAALEAVGASAKPAWNVKTDLVAIGGSTYKTHWDAGSQKRLDKSFDAVVIHSNWTNAHTQPDEYLDYGGRMIEAARKAGVEPVLELNYERKVYTDDAHYAENAAMIQKLADKYHVKVAPVGTAWLRVCKEHPEWEMYADGMHASPKGTYLAICVFYATLTGRNPAGLGTGGLAVPAGEVETLQKAAWEAVQGKAGDGAGAAGAAGAASKDEGAAAKAK